MSITFSATATDETGLVFNVDIFIDGIFRSRHICATRNGTEDLPTMIDDIINPPTSSPGE